MSLTKRDVKRAIPDAQSDMQSESFLKEYVYKPLLELDEIRLLRIEPGSWESDPQCTLSHIRLPQCPPFEALSYVWGSEEKPCKIGCGEFGTLAVTRSCFAAIKRLRQLGSLVVWIDAVCIDQENDLERGHQVKNMPHIYSSATKILVYLGEAEEDGDEAMEILRFYKWQHPNGLETHISLRRLMRRSWFERIWVLQEVNKARTVAVVCGDHVIPWDPCFRLLVQWGPENFVRKELPFILQVRGRDRNNSHTWDLLELLDNTRSYKCTDPRDRIFALLSMCSEGSRCGIEPDYTATVEEVYARAAIQFLKWRGLDVLAMVDHGSQEPSNLLPSWAPDWRMRRSCTPLVNATDCHTVYSSGEFPYLFSRNSIFQVHGHSFGMIHDLGLVFEPDDSGWDKACMGDWWSCLSRQFPDAVPSDLIRILRMSTSDHSDLFTSVRMTLRRLIQSITYTVLRIVEIGKNCQLVENVGLRSDQPRLLCSNAFLSVLGNPQPTAVGDSNFLLAFEGLESLQGHNRKYRSALIELYRARFEFVSYSAIMCHLKNVLLDEIFRRWLIEYHCGSQQSEPDTLLTDGYVPHHNTDTRHPAANLELINELDEAREMAAQIERQKREARWNECRKEFLAQSDEFFGKSADSVLISPRERAHWVARMRLRKARDTKKWSQKHKAIISLVSVRIRQQIEKVEAKELFYGGLPSELHGTPYEMLKETIERIWDLTEPEKRSPHPYQETTFTESHLILPQRINQCCIGRRLFVAENFTGLVPANAQRGDIFCSISGSRFPVLLRKVDEHEVFIGICYVVGDIKSEAEGPRWFTIT